MIALYTAMVKYRLLAEQTQDKLPKRRQLAPGLEATVAAITADLNETDAFFTTGSKLASAFVNRSDWMTYLVAAAAKSVHARNGHMPASILEREFAAAVAAGDALKALKGDAVSLLFCETRVKAGLCRKHLEHASRTNLPVILVRLASASRRAHVAPGALAFGVPRIARAPGAT